MKRISHVITNVNSAWLREGKTGKFPISDLDLRIFS